MSSQYFNDAPYPMDAFLVVVREAGFEIKRNVQAPDALIGLALINAMTMACQALIKVTLPMGQLRPVTQYVMTSSEERRVGKEGVNTYRSRVWTHHYKKKKNTIIQQTT